MSLNLEQKQAVVAEVAKEVAGAQAIVMAENRGLPVADMTQLRARARASGVYFRVVKNTLVRRADAETPFAALPSREELLAKLVATMQAPIAKLVRTMNEVPGKFVRTLAAVLEKTAAQQPSSGGNG
jgi:large subunit ribosomal protein L10